jgi:hypothetical protein
MNYPEEIEGCYLEIAATREQIKRRRSKIRALEIDIAAEATTAKGPDGKLLLSNESMRKAAIEKMTVESEEYPVLAEELGNLEKDEDKLVARLDRLRSEFKVWLLDREEQVHLTAIHAIDAIFAARQENHQFPEEVEMPF